METAAELSQELGLQRLWGRRLVTDDELSDFLEEKEFFLPAEDEADEDEKSVSKSRAASPNPLCFPTHHTHQNVGGCVAVAPWSGLPAERDEKTEPGRWEVDGATIGDLPVRYQVAGLRSHEFPVIGIFVDPRVVPGFKYRVRPIQQEDSSRRRRERLLFGGRALPLLSIGRGYSKRLTFVPDRGHLNHNPYYFWADSNQRGFGFEIELVSPGDKFTVFDPNHVPVGTLEVLQNQGPQEEVGHRVLADGSIEKTARVKALCKVEWYEGDTSEPLYVPMSGVAVGVRSRNEEGEMVVKSRVTGVTVGSHPRRGYSLSPGINSRLRSCLVRDQAVSTQYTITGLETYELPVIGTYVDPRILPGFHYRVRPAAGKRRALFGGKPLCLVSIGMGYGKRLVFQSESLNSPQNYLWSDSHPDGLGFEPSAVRAGMRFHVLTGQLRLGEATVFRADAPQVEKKHHLTEVDGEPCIQKEIQVELVCNVTLETSSGDKDQETESHVMRVSGTASLVKKRSWPVAVLERLHSIGLDSQINILFSTQWDQLLFLPLQED